MAQGTVNLKAVFIVIWTEYLLSASGLISCPHPHLLVSFFTELQGFFSYRFLLEFPKFVL